MMMVPFSDGAGRDVILAELSFGVIKRHIEHKVQQSFSAQRIIADN